MFSRLCTRRTPPVVSGLIALVVAATLLVLGCRDEGTPPEIWEEVELESQPKLFERRRGHPALAELQGLYLGQDADDARRTLREYCEHPVRRDTTQTGSEAYFLGCRLSDTEPLESIRIGFWPKIGDRVATLESKRQTVPPEAVRRRYLEVVGDEEVDETLHPRSIQITSARYRLFADWDEGPEGPTHLVVGFSPHIPTEKTRPGSR